jgi:heat shock protein HtpX|tara:strand:- start:232514 stop:233539 length:1026 start_codon:yes stop_codon:yes gene_type:complete
MPFKAVGLTTHIYNNNLRSAILLAGFPVLLFGMIYAFYFGAAKFGLLSGKAEPLNIALDTGWSMSLQYGHWALIAAALWFVIAYFSHTRMIQKMTDAAPVTYKEEPKLYSLLENLCISRGLTMPSFQIIESPALNAFASGINDRTYAITVTRGLLETLEDDELEAVLAHELTHIMNRDVRLLIISVVFVGMISFFCEMAFRSLIYGGRSRRSSSSNNKNSGGLMILGLAIMVVGYLFAIVIRFALSRKREYLADAGAVELTKNPEAMMRALMRISGHDAIKDLPEDVEMMCIENSTGFMHMFATHPPIEKRIQVLSDMTDTPIPTLKPAQKNSNPWRNGEK